MTHYYLLVHDPTTGATTIDEYTDSDLALANLREKETAKAPGTEVVLFSARSIEELQQSHPRYFFTATAGLAATAERLRTRPL